MLASALDLTLGEAEMLAVKIVVNPTIVLVSNRADDSVMQCIDPGSQAHGPNETGSMLCWNVLILNDLITKL